VANLVQTYVLHDSDEILKKHGAKRINRRDASEWNAKGYGVFHTVNHFWLNRKKDSLVEINAWCVDIDEGTKPDMIKSIQRGLRPTMLVETKRGFQAYWKSKNGTVKNWNAIQVDRLVPFYGADPNARDLARILRVPGYYHMKDPANPFMVRKIWDVPVEYTESEMLSFYVDLKAAEKARKEHRRVARANPVAGSFWDKVWNLDCEYALDRLSGSQYVGSETYSFRPMASGTRNIYVNGKGSSCWIDKEGRIGSLDNGGPTIAQWLNWFHKDYKKVVQIIQEVFPECQTSQLTLAI
jgi:hypothetical protein